MNEKLKNLITEESSAWLERAKWNQENRDWLDKSAKIAIKILREIRAQKEKNGMSQKKLAEILFVSPQYINKIVKGQENLSLETICKIEKVLGISLIEIPSFNVIQELEMNEHFAGFGLNRNNAQKIASQVGDYMAYASFEYQELTDKRA
jgi:transcriptional regulator with XRE-family HTH domain